MREVCVRAGLAARFGADAMRDQKASIHARSAEAIAAVYGELCMTPAPNAGINNHVRAVAWRHGWAPPLAWDAIDDPNEVPNPSPQNPDWEHEIDEAMVLRVVNEGGRRPRRLTNAEATECVRILIDRGHSSTVIQDVYGLKAERYYRIERAA
jgi:hypothetical protein